jgi:hypothetical protein
MEKQKNMKTELFINRKTKNRDYIYYPYVVEISAFSDCGLTQYWGTETKEEAEKCLAEEKEKCERWYVEAFPEESDFKPAVAFIHVRPQPEADGDYPDLCYWKYLH